MKYLVVDDSPTMRRIVINSLAVLGITGIVEAENGEEAWKKLKSNKIDFMITDWNMPEMNGLELVQYIRKDPEYKDLPILMVTTRGNKEDIIAALKAKVNNYMVKPFTPSTLKAKIDAIMEKL